MRWIRRCRVNEFFELFTWLGWHTYDSIPPRDSPVTLQYPQFESTIELTAFDFRRTQFIILSLLWYVVVLWYSEATFSARFFVIVCIFGAILNNVICACASPRFLQLFSKRIPLLSWRLCPTFLGVTTMLGQEMLYRSNRALRACAKTQKGDSGR